jgi:hypothetical protein
MPPTMPPTMPPEDVDKSVNPELYNDDPYDDEDEIFPFAMDDIGMAFGDLHRKSDADAPDVTDWTDVEPEYIRAFLGEVVDKVWDQACEEIELIRNSFLRNFGTRNPRTQQLVDFLLVAQQVQLLVCSKTISVGRTFNIPSSRGHYVSNAPIGCLQRSSTPNLRT